MDNLWALVPSLTGDSSGGDDGDEQEKGKEISNNSNGEKMNKKKISPASRKNRKKDCASTGGGGLVADGRDRYKHDIEQARVMMMKSNKSASQSQRLLSKDDVTLALRGLDQADEYRRAGNHQAALKLYELGLELLIKALRGESSPDNLLQDAGIEKASLEARVVCALSDAEDVKASLQQQRNQGRKNPRNMSSQKQKQPSAESSAESSSNNPTFQSITNALTSAIHRTAKTSTAPTRRPSSTAAVKTKASLRGSYQQETTNNIPTNPRNDELRNTILSDFYVAPSELQRTTWDDICGLNRVKQSLQESAILPILRPDLFNGLRKPQNILLYGPPGTGKTMLVRAVASESSSNLFVVTAGTLTSKWLGESEKLVKTLFAMANEFPPSIIFIDEVDSLLSSRKSGGDNEHEASRRLKTEFMVQMDGITSKTTTNNNSSSVLVLACTNCPWDIDAAVVRRFPKRIFVPLPDQSSRSAMLKSLLKKNAAGGDGKHSLTTKQIESLVQRTRGYSGSDIKAVCSEASFGPLRSLGGLDAIKRVRARDVRPMNIKDFDDALEHTTKSVDAQHLKRYEEWNEQQRS